MVIVQQLVIAVFRDFIGRKEIAVVTIESTWRSHPDESPAVMQQVAHIVVGQATGRGQFTREHLYAPCRQGAEI